MDMPLRSGNPHVQSGAGRSVSIGIVIHGEYMSGTDFYQQYSIPEKANLDEIQRTIAQKIADEENDSFSEGNRERLEALKQAEKVFENEQSREEYDKTISAVPEEAFAPDEAQNVIYRKWLPVVYEYYNTGNFDLAKTAYENAVSGGSPDLENSEVFEFGAKIYEGCGDWDEALKYINKAAAGQSDDAKYLIAKSNILSKFEMEARPDRVKTLVDMEKCTLELAVKVATRMEDAFSLGNAYNNLAFLWYFRGKRNRNKAQHYAEHALSLSKQWNQAKSVLQDIYDQRHCKFMKQISYEKHKMESRKEYLDKEQQRLQFVLYCRQHRVRATIQGLILLDSDKKKKREAGNEVLNYAWFFSQLKYEEEFNNYYEKVQKYADDRNALLLKYHKYCLDLIKAYDRYGVNCNLINKEYLIDIPEITC